MPVKSTGKGESVHTGFRRILSRCPKGGHIEPILSFAEADLELDCVKNPAQVTISRLSY